MFTSEKASVLIVLLAILSSSCQTKPNSTNTLSTSNVPGAPVEMRPVLTAQVKSVSLYQVPGQPQNLAISFVVSVSNSAVPSAANTWNLEVNTGNKTETLEPVRVNGVVELPGTKRTVDLAKDDLAVKTSETPISKSTQVEGVLTFVVPQASETELAANKASLRIHFKDGAGNSYQTDRVVVGQKVALK